MRVPRVFVPEPVAGRDSVVLGGTGARHLTIVLRMKPDAAVILFDGHGGEYGGTITKVEHNRVVVSVGEHRAVERESLLSVRLIQGISRGERMDWVVQKSTELGVARVTPVFTVRSTVRLDERRAERRVTHWTGVATSACEQCGRNRLPSIDMPMSLDDCLESLDDSDSPRLVLSMTGRFDLNRDPPATAVTLLVGPEGGLETSELDAAQRAGFAPFKIGPRVLRTETAAIVAITTVQSVWGDL